MSNNIIGVLPTPLLESINPHSREYIVYNSAIVALLLVCTVPGRILEHPNYFSHSSERIYLIVYSVMDTYTVYIHRSKFHFFVNRFLVVDDN